MTDSMLAVLTSDTVYFILISLQGVFIGAIIFQLFAAEPKKIALFLLALPVLAVPWIVHAGIHDALKIPVFMFIAYYGHIFTRKKFNRYIRIKTGINRAAV